MVLDAVLLPWLYNAAWLPKLTLALLPFGFLFLEGRGLKAVFITTLLYLRALGPFNLGILFLALMALAAFERIILTGFFHKTAWQSLVLSSLGLPVFYGMTWGLSRLLTPGNFYFSPGLAISLILTMILSVGLNLGFRKIPSAINPKS